MSPSKSPARGGPFGTTVAILAAMAGLALAGCSRPANNTENMADSSASAAADSGVTAMPPGSSAQTMGNAASSTDSSMMSSGAVSGAPSGN